MITFNHVRIVLNSQELPSLSMCYFLEPKKFLACICDVNFLLINSFVVLVARILIVMCLCHPIALLS